jgi:hypothetical protein
MGGEAQDDREPGISGSLTRFGLPGHLYIVEVPGDQNDFHIWLNSRGENTPHEVEISKVTR